ncbi:MAG: ROK family protein [Actinomycetota bacterium]|nr:ROK family protein [Actinomycetota bacterium]
MGGTKLAAGLVGSDGRVLARDEVPTPSTTSEDVLFEALVDLIGTVTQDCVSYDVCGVGCGGPMTLNGVLVSPLNIPAWRACPLSSKLEDTLGVSVAIDNDAKALALGEAWYGAGRRFKNFLAMVVSTGVGGGLVVDGMLLDGASGNAGHIGHVIVEPEGARCGCGAQGCLEAEASGPAIERRIGTKPSEADINEKVRAGTMVGRAVASVVNLLDLEQVLIGGSVALGFGEPFLDAANRELARRCQLEFSQGVRISTVELGHNAPIVGAAAIGFRSTEKAVRGSRSD